MAEGITRNGIEPIGRHEPHFGDEKTVYEEVTVDTYDANSDGNGNTFDLSNVYGFARVLFVNVAVTDGSAYQARYDYTNNSIRLFNLSDGSEVSQGTAVDATVRLRVVGTGG